MATKAPKKPAAKKGMGKKLLPPLKPGETRLLSGGNPQVAMGYGDGPVQAYIAAAPGWKQGVVKQLDALIVRAVPGVGKAVKWNSPFYGAPSSEPGGKGWFASLHCFEKFVRVTFFRGQSLEPIPPGPSKVKDTRYYDVHEGKLDAAQVTAWMKQASKLPGEKL